MAERVSTLLAADARRYRQWIAARMGYRPLSWFLDPGFVCVVIHRLAHSCHRRGANLPARFLMQLNSMLTGIDITPASSFGPGLLAPHPCGITMSGKAGANLTIRSRSGLGGSVTGEDVGAGPGLPVFGDDVVIGAFSGSQGGITIGNGAVIENGAGALTSLSPGEHGILATDPLIVPRAEDEAHGDQPVHAEPSLPCVHSGLRASYAAWRADAQRLLDELARYGATRRGALALLIAMTWLPVMALGIQRAGHFFWCRGHRRIARFVAGFNLLLFRLNMPAETCLGGGVLMPHLAGVLVDARIGQHPTLYANIVAAPWLPRDARPQMGSAVAVNGHSGVIGPVTIGNDVNVAPKVQLLDDAADGARIFSPMSRFKRLAAAEAAPESPAGLPPLGSEPLSPWAEYRACLPRDRARLRALAGTPSCAARIAVRLFRLGRALHRSGMRRSAHWVWRANLYLTGFDGDFASRIGPGLAMPYPAGLWLCCHAGEDLTVMAQVCVGPEADCPLDEAAARAPRLGARVRIDHHGAVYGPAMVGNDVRIMPGCSVRGAIPAGHVAMPRPIRVLAGKVGGAAVGLAS